MGVLKRVHIKWLKTLTSDYIKRLSLYYESSGNSINIFTLFEIPCCKFINHKSMMKYIIWSTLSISQLKQR